LAAIGNELAMTSLTTQSASGLRQIPEKWKKKKNAVRNDVCESTWQGKLWTAQRRSRTPTSLLSAGVVIGYFVGKSLGWFWKSGDLAAIKSISRKSRMTRS
jgi:hypothetical protein